jgi:hypothetical protein
MRNVTVALYTPKQVRYVYLEMARPGSLCLFWEKHPAQTKTIWGNRLLDRRDGSFAVNFKGLAYLRVRYG